MAFSDDFGSGVLDPNWVFVSPGGASFGFEAEGDERFLTLTTPNGDYDIFGQNNAARVMQSLADEDFHLDVRFLSTPTDRYQMQGLLVQQDTDNWIRFDTYSDGNSLYLFAAVTIDGVTSTQFNIAVSEAEVPFLKLERSGDEWTALYSLDGTNWQTAGSFTHALTVTEAGVFAGNAGPATGFTAEIDFFEVDSDPLVDEDPELPNVAPEPVDDLLAVEHDNALSIDVAADLLANDSDPDGDGLSLASFQQPANGSLLDNGDGTLTYTPNLGFFGSDSFTYSVSDGQTTSEASVVITVAAPPPPDSTLLSDDFSDGVIDAAWSFQGPAGSNGELDTRESEGFLSLTVPVGNFDIYNENEAARLMQAANDTDFQLEVGFLSTPSQKYQMQGLLVEQDANNWLRFDTYSTGSKLFAFAAITINGSSSAAINVEIAGASAPYLQVTRAGDLFTLAYSTDGTNFVTAGSFTHALTVTAAGVFAGATGGAPGFTAEVDYFENSDSPILDEDGSVTPINVAPDAVDDTLNAEHDNALSIDVAADLLANDSDPDGDSLSLASFQQPANGSLLDNGDGTLTYTPNLGFFGSDSFTYSVSDGQTASDASVVITVAAPPPPDSTLLSDDFSDGVIDAAWSFQGPAGSNGELDTRGSEGFLSLTVPVGNFDIYNENEAARLMQAANDTDFQLEVGFLSTPSQKYQMQGLLVEQDANNWLRFDTYSTGSKLFAFAAITINGSSSAAINVEIAGASAPYLQVTRAGDLFTLAYSTDGTNFVTAGSFTHALTVTAAGVFAGATGGAPGFTAEVDYFENSDSPILDEDGSVIPINVAPDAVDDTLSAEQDTGLSIDVAADLLANDSDPDGDSLSLASFQQPANGSLLDNGDGTLTYTPNLGFSGSDSFTYSVSDGQTASEASVVITVAAPPANVVSSDFSDGVIPAEFQFQGPEGTQAGIVTTAEESFVALSTSEGNFDIYGQNDAARLIQAIDNGDFSIETKFLSTPTERYEIQGLLVEQDAQNFLRFDTYSNGTKLFAYLGVNVDGSPSTLFNIALPEDSAPYLRLSRDGDSFTASYSLDGQTFVELGTVEHAMTVTGVGPFAGSTPGSGGFTAEVDYFSDSLSPIADEDGTIVPVQIAPEAGDDWATTTEASPVQVDLLSNDSDANGDALVVSSVGIPGHGVLVDEGDGVFTYTPDIGFVGLDSFTYEVTDGVDTTNATVSIRVVGPPSEIISEDFNDGVLPNGFYFVGPEGTSGGVATTSDEAFVILTTPAGDFDVFDENNSARMMQDITNGDFDVEAKFLSLPSERYQMQGILVEADAQNYLRFDTYSDGTQLRAFASITVDGNSTAVFNEKINGEAAPYIRVSRTLDDFTFSYSQDGSTYTEVGRFSHLLNVSSIGTFGASTGDAPGFTAKVDYFIDAGSPILDEDATIVPVNLAPVAGEDKLVVPEDEVLSINIAEDLLANDQDLNEDTLSLVSTTLPENATLVDNGDGTLTVTPDAGFEGVLSFSYTITDGTETATAGVEVIVGNAIQVWYGDSQQFGQPGETQQAINILGNVLSNDLVSFTYNLNNGADEQLSVGPDTKRLQENGDFNVEINYEDLDGSNTDDLVTIRAVYADGTVFARTITIDYEEDSNFDPNYTIDWENVTNLQDVVQVVDGDWHIGADGVRPTQLGYDRLLTLGDHTWDNYELNLTITTHDLLNVGQHGGGFAIGALWSGHTDVPLAGYQPKAGYEPGAAFFYTDNNADGVGKFSLHPSLNFFQSLDFSNMTLQEDTTYNFQVTIEQVGLYDRLYSLKVFEEGQAEPEGFVLQGIQNFEIGQAPATGSLYLNAHHFDVSFGDLSVTEIQGRDILQGTDKNEVLIGVDNSNLQPVATTDSYQTTEETPLVIAADTGILANDDDPNGDELTVSLLSEPANGTLTINPDGSFTYTPVENFSGTDSFRYSISDGRGGSASSSVSIDVQGTNDSPEVADAALLISEAAEAGEIVGTVSAQDVDGDDLSYSIISGNEAGVFAINAAGEIVIANPGGLDAATTPSYGLTVQVSDGLAQTQGQVDVTVAAPGTIAFSDDFSGAALDPVWSYEGIAGSAQLGSSETDGFVQIVSPPGVHVSASDFLTTPRLMQQVADEDFQVSAGFLTEPYQSFQEHGLLVVQDLQNFIRFDLAYTTGGNLRVIIGVIEDGSTDYHVREKVDSGSVTDFRISRSGDDWTFETSADGSTWEVVHTTNHSLDVGQVGLFAGSAPYNGAAVPGYTAEVDYFENSIAPLVNEDASFQGVNEDPLALEDELSTNPETDLVINVAADLLANDSDPDGDSLSIVSLTQPDNGGSLVDNGNGTLTYTPLPGFLGTDSFTYTVDDGKGGTSNATVAISVAEPNIAAPGAGEIDVFVGGGGADLFVLGDETSPFYDDGDPFDLGEEDFAFIYDFESELDQIQLSGSASDYRVSFDAAELPEVASAVVQGAALFKVGASGESDELIAVINEVASLDLESEDFIFSTLMT